MTPLLLLALLQQGPPITVNAVVDPTRTTVGGEVVLTISASTASSSPIDLTLPPIVGFTVLTRRERSEVGVGLGQRRLTVWEIHLQAAMVGRFTLGPVRVTQDRRTASATPADVDVVPGGAALATGLDPRVQSLLERAPPPPDTGVAVTILTSSATAFVGQQIDVVTAAWFPRDLRMRLRRPPTLEPPQFEGVWSYPQLVPTGIAASRQVRGTWYDLFILHQIIFPITPGTLTYSPATLRYGVPAPLQFFSQEDHYALESARPTITALALPDSGRPPAFTGGAGVGIVLERALGGTARAGEPLEVTYTLRGEGNVSLWPAPLIDWPPGLPVYPEGTDEQVAPAAGRIGGSKTFHYLVVPDSSAVLRLPVVAYPYYDLDAGHYVTTAVPALPLAVAPGGEAPRPRASPPPLLLGQGPVPAWRAVHGAPLWLALLLVFGPPLAWVWRVRPRRRRSEVARAPRRSVFGEASAELEAILGTVAGAGAMAEGGTLTAALEAAGVEPELAGRAADVWERVRAARYAGTSGADLADLAADARAVARLLGPRTRRGRRGTAVTALALAFLIGGSVRAQAPAPERLYETGALHAAALAFGERATAAPAVAANWYDLGAAEYRLGQDGDAAAAWARAARLEPRSVTLARARLLVPAPDSVSAAWLTPWLVTPEELAVLAIACWVIGWAALAVRPERSGRWWMLVGTGALVGAVAWGRARAEARPLAVARIEVAARVSPYGTAPGGRPLPVGTAVRPVRRRDGWVLVRAATGEEGWVPAAAVATVIDF